MPWACISAGNNGVALMRGSWLVMSLTIRWRVWARTQHEPIPYELALITQYGFGGAVAVVTAMLPKTPSV